MNNRSFLRPSLLNALSVILPTREETLLLRACLHSDESARQAWEEWQRHVNDLGNGFLGDNGSVKKVRLLVFNALRRYGLEVDKESQTYLRSAYLREELRSKIFRRTCQDILLLLENEAIPAIVLKGTALAETVYDNPVLRHCHDIDILMRDQDMSRAASLLPSLGFSVVNQRAEPASHHSKLEHESGLPLELHSHLFQIPYYNVPSTEMWERSQNRIIAGVPANILSPADGLLHVCGHASYAKSRESLRWVTDAWFVINRHSDLDWDRLLDCALQSHLALPLSVALGYLAEHLAAPIPSSFLDRLFAAASKSNAIERELALFGARSAPQGSLMNLFRQTRDWRERALLMQWLLLPSPSYLFSVEKVRRSWLLPFHYLYRPLRYTWYRLYYQFTGFIRRMRWRFGRLFLRINFRIP
jgi:hypothetical protein